MSSQQTEFFKDNLPTQREVTTPDSVPSSPELGSSSSSDSIASLGPHIFLTNGGGKTEEERCGDLSGQLKCDIKPGQFICGHTPMREMAEKYGTVLVVGGEGEKCRHVAEGYGFKDVVTPGDIIKHNAATTPFRKLTAEEHANSRERDFSDVVIDAVFVFADSRDWAGDIQIMLDVAMSKGGRLGTRSMGALRRMFEVTFKDLTGGNGVLHTHAFGKPQVSTFEFASRLMGQWRQTEHGLVAPPETVYFVGDTPESDIRGTNAVNKVADNDWYSILVKTGVYQEGTEPAYKPRVTVENVLDAVNHGIKREMDKKAAKGQISKPALIPESGITEIAVDMDGITI
ncbi:HAD superfamily [Fusarium oxysporum f. sp. vasinfectum]|nr:HAD superfamily [Fusarium oxysporum f. sp. vasinfectum]